MEPKEEKYSKIIGHNIVLFLSYNILFVFIFSLVTITIKLALHDIYNNFLSITLSLISGIITYNLIHFICRSSSIETLKKYKLKNDDVSKFLKEMNLIFILCSLLCIVFCISYLILFNLSYANGIQKAYEEYAQISPELANQIVAQIKVDYQLNKTGNIVFTIIYELFLVVSFISLIPYQEKLLKKFNKKV